MESQLPVGATVRLKSGSPDLKVVGPIKDAVMVEWYDGDDTIHWDMLPSTALLLMPTI